MPGGTQGNTLTGRAAANNFARAYAAESNINVSQRQQREIRQEERERRAGKKVAPDAMHTNITLAEIKGAIKKLKKKKSPGPDAITNEMLQHLGNTTLKK